MTNMTPRNTPENESGETGLTAGSRDRRFGRQVPPRRSRDLGEARRLYRSRGDGHFVAHHESGQGRLLLTDAAAIKACRSCEQGRQGPARVRGVTWVRRRR